MNHTYRLVYGEHQNAWVAVAETAKGKGKGGGRKTLKRLVAAMGSAIALHAYALPTGGQVSAGAGDGERGI